MLNKLIMAAFAGLLLAAASPALADEPAARKDRTSYNRMVRQVRVARAKLAELERRAVDQARSNGGQAPDPIKAEILSLQDEIDRKTNRLELLTLRHGWELPDFSKDDMLAGGAEAVSTRAEVFGPVDRMIRKTMQREASQIAASVYLPVISNPAAALDRRG